MENLKIGERVVRISGGHHIGRTGLIKEIDLIKLRVRVKWDNHGITWVSMNSVELESVPYKIERTIIERGWRAGRPGNPKYIKTL